MHSNEVLIDAFGRLQEVVHAASAGLSPEDLAYRVDDDANPIAWLVWHLTRVTDDHVAQVAGTEQQWTGEGWAKRFALPFDDSATGYGHSRADVAAVRVSDDELLTGYFDAVHDHTIEYLSTLTDDDLDRVVDEHWDPPVTLGVRLISVVNDATQHAGQASFVRGVTERRRL